MEIFSLICIRASAMSFLVNLFICLFLAKIQTDTEIECPFPDGPSSDSDLCMQYSACYWNGYGCQMADNDVGGYKSVSDRVDTGRGFKIDLEKIDPYSTMYESDVQKPVFEVIYHEDYHVQIKIYDPSEPRYEVPYPINLPSSAGTQPLYTVETSITGDPFQFDVVRESTGEKIFELLGPLTFDDQFIQITTRLTSEDMYGFGEHTHSTLKHDFGYRKTSGMFNRDQPVSTGREDLNHYGFHPYYVNVEDGNGNTHSVLFYTSNAMEYSTFRLSDDSPALTMRTIGGIIDLHFFMGPTPEDVNKQYAMAVGLPAFPPYWGLGFQLSRYGYDTLDNATEVRDRMKVAGIPQDVQVYDIDYMDTYKDFTHDTDKWSGLSNFIDVLHADGVKFIPILDPAIVANFNPGAYPPAENGKASDVFIKWSSPDLIPADQEPDADDYMVGYVWPDAKVVFPDFFNPATEAWWASEMDSFYHGEPQIHFDGLWIDMNDPANFGTNLDRPWNYPAEKPDWSLKCPFTKHDSPPYPTIATWNDYNECKRLSDKTICMSGLHWNGSSFFQHYDVHNLYGHAQSIATYRGLESLFPGQRQTVLSRSTYPGTGKYATHWLGDNDAQWEHLRNSIIGMLEFNMFAIPHVGADICGFFNDSPDQLCARWMELGAFYPFSRNHNSIGTLDQDPAAERYTDTPVASRNALFLRYKYLPFMYSVFHHSHMDGNSVVRPLFNVFPSDLNCREIQDQFIWGSQMMIAPIVYEDTYQREVYFPTGGWYDLVNGQKEADFSFSGTKTVDASIIEIPVYVKAGSILPFQEPDVTTDLSRLNPFGLTVALDESGSASGDMYWDDGVSVMNMGDAFEATFDYSGGILNMVTQGSTASTAGINLESINFYGISTNPSGISVNGSPLDSSAWAYDSTYEVLSVSLSVPLGQDLTLVIT